MKFENFTANIKNVCVTVVKQKVMHILEAHMTSNCRIEAALKMEVVSFFERVLLTRPRHTP
jgi:hypothetical protein